MGQQVSHPAAVTQPPGERAKLRPLQAPYVPLCDVLKAGDVEDVKDAMDKILEFGDALRYLPRESEVSGRLQTRSPEQQMKELISPVDSVDELFQHISQLAGLPMHDGRDLARPDAKRDAGETMPGVFDARVASYVKNLQSVYQMTKKEKHRHEQRLVAARAHAMSLSKVSPPPLPIPTQTCLTMGWDLVVMLLKATRKNNPEQYEQALQMIKDNLKPLKPTAYSDSMYLAPSASSAFNLLSDCLGDLAYPTAEESTEVMGARTIETLVEVGLARGSLATMLFVVLWLMKQPATSSVNLDTSICKLAALKEQPMYGKCEASGELYSCGQNSYGELGTGDDIERHQLTSISLCGWDDIRQVASGNETLAVLTNDGVVLTCGLNKSGQCGQGHFDERVMMLRPVQALRSQRVKFIAASNGCEHMIALTDSGLAYSWGYNDRGQLGHENLTTKVHVPKLIESLKDKKLRYASVSYHHSAVVTDSGELYAFGMNDCGQLGLDHTQHHSTPQLVKGFEGTEISMVACGLYHTIICTATGGLFACGKNDYGQLGLGHNRQIKVASLVSLPNEMVSYVASGYYHSVVVTNSGRTFSFGRNDYGQLGIGNKVHQNVPNVVALSANTRMVRATCGCYHTVLLSEQGQVFVFGRNNKGQLGNRGSADALLPVPLKVRPEKNSRRCVDVAAGFYTTSLIVERKRDNDESDSIMLDQSCVISVCGRVDIDRSGEIEGLSNFGSISTIGVSLFRGKWFYEVEVVTSGLIQVGWIDGYFQGSSDQGEGVGDHNHSWSYDGNRQRRWNSGSSSYGEKWRAGDVIGCLLDLTTQEMTFFRNGVNLGVAYSEFKCSEDDKRSGMMPGISLERGEIIRVNLGHQPFAYPAVGHDFESVSRAVQLPSSSAVIQPPEDHTTGGFSIEPPPLEGSSSVMIGDKLFVVGGMIRNESSLSQPNEPTNQVWMYDITAKHWERWTDFPIEICHHQVVAVDDNHILVLGGEKDCAASRHMDLYKCSTLKNADGSMPTWTLIQAAIGAATALPQPRASHTAATIHARLDTIVFMYGGKSVDDEILGDVWYLSLDDFTWSRLPSSVSLDPGSRTGCSSAVIGESVYVFGGKDREDKFRSDLWRYNTFDRIWHLCHDDNIAGNNVPTEEADSVQLSRCLYRSLCIDPKEATFSALYALLENITTRFFGMDAPDEKSNSTSPVTHVLYPMLVTIRLLKLNFFEFARSCLDGSEIGLPATSYQPGGVLILIRDALFTIADHVLQTPLSGEALWFYHAIKHETASAIYHGFPTLFPSFLDRLQVMNRLKVTNQNSEEEMTPAQKLLVPMLVPSFTSAKMLFQLITDPNVLFTVDGLSDEVVSESVITFMGTLLDSLWAQTKDAMAHSSEDMTKLLQSLEAIETSHEFNCLNIMLRAAIFWCECSTQRGWVIIESLEALSSKLHATLVILSKQGHLQPSGVAVDVRPAFNNCAETDFVDTAAVSVSQELTTCLLNQSNTKSSVTYGQILKSLWDKITHAKGYTSWKVKELTQNEEIRRVTIPSDLAKLFGTDSLLMKSGPEPLVEYDSSRISFLPSRTLLSQHLYPVSEGLPPTPERLQVVVWVGSHYAATLILGGELDGGVVSEKWLQSPLFRGGLDETWPDIDTSNNEVGRNETLLLQVVENVGNGKKLLDKVRNALDPGSAPGGGNPQLRAARLKRQDSVEATLEKSGGIEAVDRAVRATFAALLKHTNISYTTEPISNQGRLAETVVDAWKAALQLRRWIVREQQKLAAVVTETGAPSGFSPDMGVKERQQALYNAVCEPIIRKALVLLQLSPAPIQSTSPASSPMRLLPGISMATTYDFAKASQSGSAETPDKEPEKKRFTRQLNKLMETNWKGWQTFVQHDASDNSSADVNSSEKYAILPAATGSKFPNIICSRYITLGTDLRKLTITHKSLEGNDDCSNVSQNNGGLAVLDKSFYRGRWYWEVSIRALGDIPVFVGVTPGTTDLNTYIPGMVVSVVCSCIAKAILETWLDQAASAGIAVTSSDDHFETIVASQGFENESIFVEIRVVATGKDGRAALSFSIQKLDVKWRSAEDVLEWGIFGILFDFEKATATLYSDRLEPEVCHFNVAALSKPLFPAVSALCNGTVFDVNFHPHPRLELPSHVFYPATKLQNQLTASSTELQLGKTLQLQLYSCDGGEFSSSHTASNCLVDDTTVYSSAKGANVNLVFKHELDTPMCVSYITIRGPGQGYSSPLRCAAVFVTSTPPDLSSYQEFDNMTPEQFAALPFPPSNGCCPRDETLPVALFVLDSSCTQISKQLAYPATGRYIIVKAIRPSTGTNIDIGYLGFCGIFDRDNGPAYGETTTTSYRCEECKRMPLPGLHYGQHDDDSIKLCTACYDDNRGDLDSAFYVYTSRESEEDQMAVNTLLCPPRRSWNDKIAALSDVLSKSKTPKAARDGSTAGEAGRSEMLPTVASFEECELFSCGQNNYGELCLGHCNSTSKLEHVPFFSAKGIRDVAGGNEVLAVVMNDGGVFTCGLNKSGQCGNGTFEERVIIATPVRALSGIAISMVAAANGCEHMLAVASDGAVFSWGYNDRGQLGLGSTISKSHTPRMIDSLREKYHITTAAVSYHHSAVVSSNGELLTFGMNDCGQLGLDHTQHQHTPQVVDALSSQVVTKAACGLYHTVAATSDGEVYSFGKNDYGQLGLGHARNIKTPALVKTSLGESDEKIVAVSCGYYHTVTISEKGKLITWGRNDYGQLGIGSKEHKNSAQFVPLPMSSKIKNASCGCYHSLILMSNGRVMVFGRNNKGQLGAGARTLSSADLPLPVPSNSLANDEVVRIAAGFYSSYILTGRSSDNADLDGAADDVNQSKDLPENSCLENSDALFESLMKEIDSKYVTDVVPKRTPLQLMRGYPQRKLPLVKLHSAGWAMARALMYRSIQDADDKTSKRAGGRVNPVLSLFIRFLLENLKLLQDDSLSGAVWTATSSFELGGSVSLKRVCVGLLQYFGAKFAVPSPTVGLVGGQTLDKLHGHFYKNQILSVLLACGSANTNVGSTIAANPVVTAHIIGGMNSSDVASATMCIRLAMLVFPHHSMSALNTIYRSQQSTPATSGDILTMLMTLVGLPMLLRPRLCSHELVVLEKVHVADSKAAEVVALLRYLTLYPTWKVAINAAITRGFARSNKVGELLDAICAYYTNVQQADIVDLQTAVLGGLAGDKDATSLRKPESTTSSPETDESVNNTVDSNTQAEESESTSRDKQSLLLWQKAKDALDGLAMIIAAVSIVGGHVEGFREGGCVTIEDDGTQGSRRLGVLSGVMRDPRTADLLAQVVVNSSAEAPVSPLIPADARAQAFSLSKLHVVERVPALVDMFGDVEGIITTLSSLVSEVLSVDKECATHCDLELPQNNSVQEVLRNRLKIKGVIVFTETDLDPQSNAVKYGFPTRIKPGLIAIVREFAFVGQQIRGDGTRNCDYSSKAMDLCKAAPIFLDTEEVIDSALDHYEVEMRDQVVQKLGSENALSWGMDAIQSPRRKVTHPSFAGSGGAKQRADRSSDGDLPFGTWGILLPLPPLNENEHAVGPGSSAIDYTPFPLTAPIIRVGRAADACDLIVNDRSVSGRHFHLRRLRREAEGGETQFELQDFSKNGTIVNGVRIHGSSTRITTGSRISLILSRGGLVTYEFQVRGSTGGRHPAILTGSQNPGDLNISIPGQEYQQPQLAHPRSYHGVLQNCKTAGTVEVLSLWRVSLITEAVRQ
ncbi:hypothetical protein PInf_012542 [Phytophthora infestans]|nr:hypothetical protein PInf_012542 [Phytophthora infestans]